MEFFIEQISLRYGHAKVLIIDSVKYAVPSAIYLIIESFKKNNNLIPTDSLFQRVLERKNPVFLYNLFRLNPEKFLRLAQGLQLNQKIIIIELLWILGSFPVKWFLASWRNKILKDGGDEVKSAGKVFLDLIFHFAAKYQFGATNFNEAMEISFGKKK